MNLFGFKLSNWDKYGSNYYRIAIYNEYDIYIGLRCRSSNFNPLHYRMVCFKLGKNHVYEEYIDIQNIFEKMFNNNFGYIESELDKAKNDIDIFIIKLDKLKAFI